MIFIVTFHPNMFPWHSGYPVKVNIILTRILHVLEQKPKADRKFSRCAFDFVPTKGHLAHVHRIGSVQCFFVCQHSRCISHDDDHYYEYFLELCTVLYMTI